MPVFLSILVFLGAVVLLILDVEPVPTWFYVFAWYPTLVLLDEFAHRVGGRERLLRNSRLMVSLLGWSAVIWLVFEAANFRLDNWYYIFLPRNAVERWAGILLAFATVLPAVLLAERVLDVIGVARSWKPRPVRLRSRDLWLAAAIGLAQLASALIWPRNFFPFIWAAGFLIAEPFVYRRRPDLSLIADLEWGNWGRIARLMLGGLGIGLLWEFYNYWARGKWVYTVPWLEGTKWFEMPPFGFVGFAFFALEAWSMYAALCAARIAIPVDGSRVTQPRYSAVGALAAILLAVAILLGMERWTISSVVPRLADLPDMTPAEQAALNRAGISTPFILARLPTGSQLDGLSPDRADSLVAAARLAVLRGMGVAHVRQLREIGVDDACKLSTENPPVLWTAIHLNHSARRPTLAEVRVWVAAAGRACPPGHS